MSTQAKFEIKVRRHPVFALVFMALGGGLIALGFVMNQYAFMVLGGMTLIPGGFAFIYPAIVINTEAVELKNLLGFTGRVIPHDGLDQLDTREGKLVIVYGGRRAVLPRPNAKALHKADWKVMAEALEKARSIKKK